MWECLVLGPEGAGKTVLIRKLEEYSKRKKTAVPQAEGQDTSSDANLFPASHHTVPTVGVNLAQLKIAKGAVCSLRESGGQMAPLWSGGYEDCSMVIYVIDSSNRAQVSASVILLLEALSSPALKEKPVLLFFNKTDTPLGLGLVEYKSVMRLDDIVTHATRDLAVVEGSCWTGDGIGTIFEWLVQKCKC